MTPTIALRNTRKDYGKITAVDDIDFNVNQGTITVLLGPSGCGKTTTLRLIAGLERPDAGEIRLNGEVIAGPSRWVPPEKRRGGMVFQDYALFPHLNVLENITFGLHERSRTHKSDRAEELLDLVGLTGLGLRMPYELSGGQQQRVALARALAPNPTVLLLDEPFSNLDAALRNQVRTEVRHILKATGVTSIFVTHDQEEALSISDQVVVMFSGKVAQVGSPQVIYTQPASPQVATFVGAANFIPATATGNQAACLLGQVDLIEPAHGTVTLLIRPETLQLSDKGIGTPATVTQVEFYGHDQSILLHLGDDISVTARTDAYQHFEVGQRVNVTVHRPAQAFASA